MYLLYKNDFIHFSNITRFIVNNFNFVSDLNGVTNRNHKIMLVSLNIVKELICTKNECLTPSTF